MIKTLYFYGVEGELDKKSIIKGIMEKQPERVVLFGETEWEIQGVDKELVDICKSHNVKLKIVHGTYVSDHHINLYRDIGLDINDVAFWGTQFFNFIEWVINNRHPGYENFIPSNSYKYPFLNMNCRSHIHRCTLIDELAGRDLISKGKVSWHDHLEENQDFVFKHFDRKQKIRLGDEFETKLDSTMIPDCYFDTFMVLVTEATLKAPFFTEKTVMPILFKKPFLVIAGKNHNKEFFKLGFEPYDEIFDYSFDSVDDLPTRVSKAVDNVERIIGSDYVALYNKIKDKIEHNFELAIKISKDHNYIPEIVKEKVKLNNLGVYKENNMDVRYRIHLDRCGYFTQ
jgi:hypothetical protein